MKFFEILSLCSVLLLLGSLSSSFHRSLRQLDNSYGSPAYKYCECGRSNSPRLMTGYTRVVGGVESLPNEFPWMAMVVVNGSNLICGGTLINDRYVLSAAHCLVLGKAETKVILGEHDRCTKDSRTVILSVEKFYPHPHFQEVTNYADVMLIRLNMRITFNEFIRPICLPKMMPKRNTAVSQFGKQLAFTLGWGRADLVAEVCALRIVALEIYESEFCPTEISTLFCAGARIDGRDACQVISRIIKPVELFAGYVMTLCQLRVFERECMHGDSGGPLQIRNSNKKFELIGIVSNGIGCGDQSFPGLYTDVLRLLPWILEVTSRDSMYCWR